MVLEILGRPQKIIQVSRKLGHAQNQGPLRYSKPNHSLIIILGTYIPCYRDDTWLFVPKEETKLASAEKIDKWRKKYIQEMVSS